MGALAFGSSVCCKYPDWRLLCGSLRRSLFCHPFQLHYCPSLERNRDLICRGKKDHLRKSDKIQWGQKQPGNEFAVRKYVSWRSCQNNLYQQRTIKCYEIWAFLHCYCRFSESMFISQKWCSPWPTVAAWPSAPCFKQIQQLCSTLEAASSPNSEVFPRSSKIQGEFCN